MTFLDKFCFGLLGVSVFTIVYDDIRQELNGLFEAEASIPVQTYSNNVQSEEYICDYKWENCTDIRAVGYDSLKNKPMMPLGYIPSKKHIDCLAQNIFQEAGTEPLIGKIAVAFGTIQRVKDGGYYKKNLCGAVFQKAWDKDKRKWVAQMSWTLNKRKVNMPTPPIYRTIAIDVLSGKYNHPDPTCPFTNWHNPIDHEGNFNADQWKKGKTSCTRTIGQHTYIAFK